MTLPKRILIAPSPVPSKPDIRFAEVVSETVAANACHQVLIFHL